MIAVLILIFNHIGIVQAAAKEPPTSLLIHVKTGITLNYVVQGNPQGPVIVLLHGAGDSWHSYDRVLSLIPEKYRVYAITLRGHGLSDHPETGYTRADFAADILDFLDQLQIIRLIEGSDQLHICARLPGRHDLSSGSSTVL